MAKMRRITNWPRARDTAFAFIVALAAAPHLFSLHGQELSRVELSATESAVASDQGHAIPETSADGKAVDQRFWSFRPIRDPEPPVVERGAWPRTAIDRFILARIEGAALVPNPRADRHTLVRRLYFDLIGLPPTPEQIQRFTDDDDPGVYPALVERLLASPLFGERWGRHWLDVARFAESSGGGRTLILLHAWRYRDYVIRALNTDKPVTDFIAEQIAGDLLEADDRLTRRDQLIATGFLLLGPTNYELQDKELLRMEVIDEQIDTVGRAFLGMTIGCARCHDHKFDPVPTEDYYALAGIFRSTKSLVPGNVSGYETQTLPVTAARRSAWDVYESRLGELADQSRKAQKAQKQLEQQLAQLRAQKSALLGGVVFDDTEAKTVGTWQKSTHDPRHVGPHYLHDQNKGKGDKSITYPLNLEDAGRYEVLVSYSAGSGRAAEVPITVRHAEGVAEITLDQRRGQPVADQWASIGEFSFDAIRRGSITISNRGTSGHVIADAVQLVPVDKNPNRNTAVDAALEQQIEASRQKVIASRGRVKALKTELDEWKKTAPPPLPVAMAVREHAAEQQGDWHVCIRGNLRNLGHVVPRGFLHAAGSESPPDIASDESGRRELASWLTGNENPLVARVYANRVWQHLLGAGLVRTPDNFGMTGERPTHPDLLDWLASRLRENEWSTKDLIRQIVMSATYQQSSDPAEAAEAADPENRLLARAHRKRLEAEALRDAMLAIGGQLDASQGGRLFAADFKSELEYRFASQRRSVYVAAFRNRRHELFDVFDGADPNLVTGQRSASTLPTQALLMMNSPFVIEQATEAADHLLSTTKDGDILRVRRAYVATLGRAPTDGEQRVALDFINTAGDAKNAYAQLYQALFGSIDFRYLD